MTCMACACTWSPMQTLSFLLSVLSLSTYLTCLLPAIFDHKGEVSVLKDTGSTQW